MVLSLGVGLLYTAWADKAKKPLSGLNVEIQQDYGLFTAKEMERKVRYFLGRPLEGIRVKDLRLVELERYLDQHPFIKSADAYADSRHLLHVRIEMRQPVVRIMDFKGNSQFMDMEGSLMPINTTHTFRVPIATGLDRIQQLDREAYEELLKGLHTLALAISKDTFMLQLTEQIYLDEEKNFVLVPKIGRERIVVGEADRLEEKFEKLKLFYREGLRRTGFGKYKSIDLRFKNQVVGKLKST